MPRQNRVDPLGALHAVPDRGALMGNRGCLHDDAGRIRRGHAGRRWIACLPAFRGRQRALMQPGRYTELFFLDEATAYAAGHRPCAECRRADWRAFQGLWARVHRAAGADQIDAALHVARLDGRARRLTVADPSTLPAGAMVLARGAPALVTAQGLVPWSFAGYGSARPWDGPVHVITPAPLLPLIRAGLPVQTAGPAPDAALRPPLTPPQGPVL